MKSIVVVAYYHLMHAIALAMTFEEKPILYLCVDYTKMTDDIVENIRDSGVFYDVVKLDTKEFLSDFVKELRKTKDAKPKEIEEIGTSLFDEHIDAYYYPHFKDADFDEDIYIYTEYHLMFYSITKHFRNIILCEDGYKVMNKRLVTFKYMGYFKLLRPFIEAGYYPKMEFQCEKITKLICSGDHEDLPEFLRKKVYLWDIRDIIRENREEYRTALQGIFLKDGLDIRDGSLLLIEQPLYRTRFCNDLRYYLFYKKLIKELSADRQVIIKPHPAGSKQVDVFQNDNVEVVPKWVPVECLNYVDVTFDSVVTFYSAALDLMENTRTKESLYNQDEITNAGIKRYIREYIQGERVDIGLYIYFSGVHDRFVKELKRYFKNNKRFWFHVHILCPQEHVAEAEAAAGRVEELAGEPIPVIACEDFDQDEILRMLIKEGQAYDFSVGITGHSKTKDVKRILKKLCKGSMAHCIGINQLSGKSITVCNPLDEHVLTGVVNVMWSSHILHLFEKNGVKSAAEAIEYVYSNSISTTFIDREFLITYKDCRKDVGTFARRCRDERLSGFLKAYSDILESIGEGRFTQNVPPDITKQCFPESSVEDRELYIRALMIAMNNEHKLRNKHFRRVEKLENGKAVATVLALIRFKKRTIKKIKKKIKKIRKKIKRKVKAFLRAVGLRKYE